jgi:hypothetical protein
MTVTTRTLTRAAAVCAAAAGAIFIAVQINHPPADSFLTNTGEWVVRSIAKTVMCALALAGITGVYLRQVRQMRVLGLVGFTLFAARVLARWAAALLAASTVATAALAVLPESFNRPMAVPEGIALIALGVSLWRDQRSPAPSPAAELVAGDRVAGR